MPSAEVSGESGGLGRFGVVLGWAGSAEGDFQAEFFEFADVVGDLAAGLGAALVIVLSGSRTRPLVLSWASMRFSRIR